MFCGGERIIIYIYVRDKWVVHDVSPCKSDNIKIFNHNKKQENERQKKFSANAEFQKIINQQQH